MTPTDLFMVIFVTISLAFLAVTLAVISSERPYDD